LLKQTPFSTRNPWFLVDSDGRFSLDSLYHEMIVTHKRMNEHTGVSVSLFSVDSDGCFSLDSLYHEMIVTRERMNEHTCVSSYSVDFISRFLFYSRTDYNPNDVRNLPVALVIPSQAAVSVPTITKSSMQGESMLPFRAYHEATFSSWPAASLRWAFLLRGCKTSLCS
jgi:hypothetical protein